MRLIGLRFAMGGGGYGRGILLGVLLLVVLFAGSAQAQTPEIESKQAEASKAQARIQSTMKDLAGIQAAYNDSQDRLGQIEDDIRTNENELKKTGEKLNAAEDRLSERSAISYKSGNVMYLDVLLSVRSFSDLSNKGRILLQVLKQDRDAVTKIKGIKEKLSTQQEELKAKKEKQVQISAKMRDQQASMNQRLEQQRATYDSLSAEVKQMIQEEQQRQAREAVERLAKAEAQANAREAAKQQAAAEQAAATEAARQQMAQVNASNQASAEAEKQAAAETTARQQRQQLAVQAAEADKKAEQAKAKAQKKQLAVQAEKARKEAEKQAAAEKAAHEKQQQLIEQANKAARQAQQKTDQNGQQADQQKQTAQESPGSAGQSAAKDQSVAGDAAAEDQYQENSDGSASGSSAADTSTSDFSSPEQGSPVTSSDPNVQAILDDPNISLTSMAQQDLSAGIVDSRVLDVVKFAAQDHSIGISVFKTGHPYGPTLDAIGLAGYPNSHYYGRAVDIYEVDGVPVSSSNQAAHDLAQAIEDNFAPEELGSPWVFGSGSFTNAMHQDHIHVGWAYAADGGL